MNGSKVLSSVLKIQYHIEIYNPECCETLLFFHGFSENCSTFYTLLPYLKAFRVILIDLLGHGKTKDQLEHYSFDIAIVSIHAQLKKLNVSSVSIYGYSLGGRVAQHFTLRYLDMVSCLIIESSSFGLETDIEKNARLEFDQTIIDMLNKGIGKFNHYWKNLPLFSSQKQCSSAVLKNIESRRLSNSPTQLIKVIHAFSPAQHGYLKTTMQQLKGIRVTYIAGELDKKYCKIGSDYQLALRCEYHVIKGCGHNAHIERPQSVATIIHACMKKLKTEKTP